MEEAAFEQDMKIISDAAEWIEFQGEKERLLTNRLH